MHRLTEIAANGDVEVQPRYQAAALRRLAAYEDMHQDLEGQLENVNEKLADIEELGRPSGATAVRPANRHQSDARNVRGLRNFVIRPSSSSFEESPEATAGYRSLCSLCARFAVFRIGIRNT